MNNSKLKMYDYARRLADVLTKDYTDKLTPGEPSRPPKKNKGKNNVHSNSRKNSSKN